MSFFPALFSWFLSSFGLNWSNISDVCFNSRHSHPSQILNKKPMYKTRRKNPMNILERLTPGNRNMDLQPYLWSCYLPLGVFACAERAACHNGSFVLTHNSPVGAADLLMVSFFSWGKKRALVLFMLNWNSQVKIHAEQHFLYFLTQAAFS